MLFLIFLCLFSHNLKFYVIPNISLKSYLSLLLFIPNFMYGQCCNYWTIGCFYDGEKFNSIYLFIFFFIEMVEILNIQYTKV